MAMIWPLGRRHRGRHAKAPGNGHALRRAREEAERDLREVRARQPVVDRLARDIERGMGVGQWSTRR